MSNLRVRPSDRELTSQERTEFGILSDILYNGIPNNKCSLEYQFGDGLYHYRSLHDYGYFSEDGVDELFQAVYIFSALVSLTDITFNDLPQELVDMYTKLETHTSQIS
jgi:hypothetical protein